MIKMIFLIQPKNVFNNQMHNKAKQLTQQKKISSLLMHKILGSVIEINDWPPNLEVSGKSISSLQRC